MKDVISFYKNIFFMSLGAFLAALSLKIFLIPHHLIDGGIIGLALICARLTNYSYLPYFLVIFNLPFIYLAYKAIRKSFVIYMLISIILFAIFLSLISNFAIPFKGDPLEIIVFGGALLGTGVGLIIRNGGCTDGTEILGIILNRKIGFTIGQIVLFINIFIFGIYALIFKDWNIALKSLMTYFVAFKMIDLVIAGLEEIKSVMIITSQYKKIKKIVTHELGLGLTVFHGIGGFSGEDTHILYVIVERLDLAALKDIVLKEDPNAFLAIENLHEVVYGKQTRNIFIKKEKKGKIIF